MGAIVNNRLESSTRGTDLLPGLHGRVHDALWLLARQWQLGELDALDAGTPINAAYVARYARLATWQPAGGPAASYDAGAPIEAVVEADGSSLPWRDVVAAGLRLCRALRRAGVDARTLVAAHPLAVPDPAVDPDHAPVAQATSAVTPDEVAAVGAVTAGRVPDPVAVAAAFDADADALVTAAGGERAREAIANWRIWWASRQPASSGAWQTGELSYAFTAWTNDPAIPSFGAERFGGGALDWHAFDAGAPGAEPADAKADLPAPITTYAVPVPVTFHGSPVGRYWQLDDARTDFGALDTYPTEIAKVLLAEFTACFAGDWFRLPVRVPYGSAVRIEALVSTDTFGVSMLIPRASSAPGVRPWRMFEHTDGTAGAATAGPPPDEGWLLVPPVLAASVDSAPVEDVLLVRDPAADLCWGIERIVTNAVGRAVRRSEDLLAQGRVPQPDARDGLPGAWVWRLETSVPENWIPFLPTRGRAEDDDYLLVQGSMIRYTRTAAGEIAAVPVLPAGLLLRAGGTLPEREIPREGVAVQRSRRLARRPDGGRVLWPTRRVEVGHGEASSGLAYDGLHPSSSDATALGQ